MDYQIIITESDDNKIDVRIEHQKAKTRHFRIHVTKDGLQIMTESQMEIKPKASNMIMLDDLA